MAARILIVDDHDVVRQGVRSFLAIRPDWEVCGEAATGEQAIRAVSALQPDVVILDLTMPGMSGLEAASRIAALGTPARVLIFTMHESQRIASDVREAGAHGYVQKSQAARDLILAIERLLSGNSFFDSRLQPQPEDTPSGPADPESGVLLFRAFCFA